MNHEDQIYIAAKIGMVVSQRARGAPTSYIATDLAGNLLITVMLPRFVSATWWWVAKRFVLTQEGSR